MIQPSLVRKRSEGAEVSAAIDGGDAVDLDDLLLDQRGIVEGHRWCAGAPFDLPAASGLLRFMSAASVPKAAKRGCAAVDPGAAARNGWSGTVR